MARFGKLGLARVLRRALWLAAALVGTLVLLVLAGSRWPWLQRAEIAALRTVRSAAGIPALALTRDPRCTLGDAFRHWRVSQLSAMGPLEQRSKPLGEDGALSHISTPLGDYWFPRRERSGFFEELAEQEAQLYGSGSVTVRPGDVVLDCGANLGLTVRWELARGARLVVAIEPAPVPLQCLRRNLSREIAEGRVIVYPKGVWDRDAELVLTETSERSTGAASVAIDRGHPVARIPLTTIDKLVAELKLDRVDFIKMDIEGAEPQALRGAVATVARYRPRMAIALEHRPSDPANLSALVQRLWPGYAVRCGKCANLDGHLQPEVLFASGR